MLNYSPVYAFFSTSRVLISSLLGLLLLTISAYASSENATTRKAEIIKQLFSIVSWPSSVLSENNFHICILGRVDEPKSLAELNGQIVNQRKLVVKNIKMANEAKKK